MRFRLVFAARRSVDGRVMKFSVWKILLGLLVVPLAAAAANPALAGRWRLDPKRSTALDGWTTWDLVVSLEGPRVRLLHDMTWRSTKFAATNVVDTAHPTEVKDFFRVEQRHMAVHPIRGSLTPVRAEWLDGDRTLRIEAVVPVEVSQGNTTLRTYQELRLLEGGRELLLIELHGTRDQPYIYRFTKITGEN